MATAKERLQECQVKIGGRWTKGYHAEPYHVTKKAAKARARTLGLKTSQVPHGPWYSVLVVDQVYKKGEKGAEYEGGRGWREVPASCVRAVT